MPALISQSWKLSSSLALILSILAVFVAVGAQTTQCASAAAGSCSVGDTEVFADNLAIQGGTTFSHTLTAAPTANQTSTLPDASGIIAILSKTQTFTATQTFADGIILDPTERIGFDGTTTGTYMVEESDDDWHLNVGGFPYIQVDQDLNAIGIGLSVAPVASIGLIYSPTFAAGASGNARGSMFNPTLTAANGTTAQIVGHRQAAILNTQGNTEVIANVAQQVIKEPSITVGAGDTVTRASVLWLDGVPTEATTNNGIYMPLGSFEVSDGQGTAGEQLTSGGANGNLTWTAAASTRAVKRNVVERIDYAVALAAMVAAPVYDFNYKPNVTEQYLDERGNTQTRIATGQRTRSTGDYATTYTGIMADEAPWAMHHDGTILNPISTFGYTVMSIKALVAINDDLQGQVDSLEARILALESVN